MTSFGEIDEVPIKSLDHNGGLVVNAFDFVGDSCNDYNGDGEVNSRDWDLFAPHLGETCIDGPATRFLVDVFTRPGPDSLFVGDTISVCARVRNTVNEPAMLDDVVFTTAGWGIAQPWTEFDRITDVPIGPLKTVTVGVPFEIPSHIPRLSCWRAAVTPSLINKSSVCR